MIQRKQSIFLLATAIVMLFFVLKPVTYISAKTETKQINISYKDAHFVKESVDVFNSNNKVQYLMWAMIVMVFITIFLFKNRKLQLMLCGFLFLLFLLLLYSMYASIHTFSNGESIISTDLPVINYLWLLNFIFWAFAAYNIYKDELLVKSLDRLR